MMSDLFSDLSLLTGITLNTFYKLSDKSCALINHYVNESLRQGTTTVEINFGIGILYVQAMKDCIKYKFVPSKRLEKSVKSALVDKEDTELTNLIDKTLEKRITDTYKELL